MSSERLTSGGADGGGGGRFVSIVNPEDGWPRIIVRWSALFGSIIGGFVLGWFEAFIALIQSLVGAWTLSQRAMTDVFTNVIRAVFSVQSAIPIAVSETEAAVAGSSLASFALGALVVGLAAYAIQLGVSQLVE